MMVWIPPINGNFHWTTTQKLRRSRPRTRIQPSITWRSMHSEQMEDSQHPFISRKYPHHLSKISSSSLTMYSDRLISTSSLARCFALQDLVGLNLHDLRCLECNLCPKLVYNHILHWSWKITTSNGIPWTCAQKLPLSFSTTVILRYLAVNTSVSIFLMHCWILYDLDDPERGRFRRHIVCVLLWCIFKFWRW